MIGKSDGILVANYPTLFRILRTYEADCSTDQHHQQDTTSESSCDDVSSHHLTGSHVSSSSPPGERAESGGQQTPPSDSSNQNNANKMMCSFQNMISTAFNQQNRNETSANRIETSCSLVTSTTPPIGHTPSNRIYPAGHPMAMAKHICAICGDRASGKHYGVFSCEGCKGFFKRTVRKSLHYTCRESKKCVIDKKQRNRCQYCRYLKCQLMGMKREAVQEERSRQKPEEAGTEPSSTSHNNEMPIELILDAQLMLEQSGENNLQNEPLDDIKIVESAIRQTIDWARCIPHFMELTLTDQATLIHNGWNELIVSMIAYYSTPHQLLLWPSHSHVSRDMCDNQIMYDRIINELNIKLTDLGVDKAELGCLRTIILFNPDSPNVQAFNQIDSYRELIYQTLDTHCRRARPNDPGRLAKLLLRLPALRSISIKCYDTMCNIIPLAPSPAYLLQTLTQQPVVARRMAQPIIHNNIPIFD